MERQPVSRSDGGREVFLAFVREPHPMRIRTLKREQKDAPNPHLEGTVVQDDHTDGRDNVAWTSQGKVTLRMDTQPDVICPPPAEHLPGKSCRADSGCVDRYGGGDGHPFGLREDSRTSTTRRP